MFQVNKIELFNVCMAYPCEKIQEQSQIWGHLVNILCDAGCIPIKWDSFFLQKYTFIVTKMVTNSFFKVIAIVSYTFFPSLRQFLVASPKNWLFLPSNQCFKPSIVLKVSFHRWGFRITSINFITYKTVVWANLHADVVKWVEIC